MKNSLDDSNDGGFSDNYEDTSFFNEKSKSPKNSLLPENKSPIPAK